MKMKTSSPLFSDNFPRFYPITWCLLSVIPERTHAHSTAANCHSNTVLRFLRWATTREESTTLNQLDAPAHRCICIILFALFCCGKLTHLHLCRLSTLLNTTTKTKKSRKWLDIFRVRFAFNLCEYVMQSIPSDPSPLSATTKSPELVKLNTVSVVTAVNHIDDVAWRSVASSLFCEFAKYILLEQFHGCNHPAAKLNPRWLWMKCEFIQGHVMMHRWRMMFI